MSNEIKSSDAKEHQADGENLLVNVLMYIHHFFKKCFIVEYKYKPNEAKTTPEKNMKLNKQAKEVKLLKLKV